MPPEPGWTWREALKYNLQITLFVAAIFALLYPFIGDVAEDHAHHPYLEQRSQR